MKQVSVVTVNYNHSHVTDAMLDSIANKNTYPFLQIIVVDNGSRDNPVPEWKEKYPEILFIRTEVNLGFAGGNNLGIHQATGDYLFFANNDTEFTDTLIERLVATLEENPAIGIVSPKIRYYDQPDMLQYAGYTQINYYTARNACIGQYEQDKGQYDHVTGSTGYAHGAAMMVRREAIEKAGLMAENYFLYYEELDWCERIKRAGFEIHVNMQALIYHKESVSVGKKTALKEYFMNRNRILFTRKNAPPVAKFIFYCYFAAIVTPRNLLVYIKNKQWNFVMVYFRAISWNLTHRTGSSNLGYPLNK
ncbi:MAG: glycosyltransferase family 2 protein [Taibaiella sp.]|nr:glycosyltransferase family 2 protein [Taibaiella sp.]